ncbi:MAG: fumarylacetoacetate hydrolase family protein [Bryobacteraceae bacterium]|nr:fumarylacetoacetate hydrolase family protein [Bryobacteraceae bacterium]MDW8379128.1 fumarylacetoacetate hydrolase family protein [Bryobacterales bacterium]
MRKHIRFSPNRKTWPTAPDSSPLVRYGIVQGDTVYETDSLWSTETKDEFALTDIRLLPPCWPSKIVCVGRNYADHAKELGNPVPSEPLIFYKPVSSLLASGDSIVYPSLSQMVSFEGELGVVVGRQAKFVRAEDALDYVFGYTIVNDVTARDLQKKDGQWARAKGFDTFCPVGPWIVPAREVDFDRLRIRTWVNGEKKQDGSVQEMIFSVSAIIAYVTQFLTLEPGDLIATGTPPGVGPLEPGDTVRVEIEGIGALENTVVRG